MFDKFVCLCNLLAVAARTAGGYVPRANRPELLVVDPALAPLFRQAVTLAAELGITLPAVEMLPSEGLLELVAARIWSRGVNPNPLVDAAPLEWLTASGYGATRAFLSDLVAAHGQGSVRLLPVAGDVRPAEQRQNRKEARSQMQPGDVYKNGQKKREFKDGTLYIYFENGGLKAVGGYANGKMCGEWLFYRKTGQLWQVGHLKDDIKHGHWIRYNVDGTVEKETEFADGKELP